MIQSYHRGRFEFFIVVIVVAIIAIAALSRYTLMARDAQILRLEIISHHFMTGVANARVQFLLESAINKNTASPEVSYSGRQLYFSPQGWPASTSTKVADDYRPTDDDCYQLWGSLLQNPPPIANGLAVKAKGEYRVFALEDACRYQFEEGYAYFDYFPLSGKLIFEPASN